MDPLQKSTINGVVLKSFEIHSINITHLGFCISLPLSLENRPNVSNFGKIPQIQARFLAFRRFSPQRGHLVQMSRWWGAPTICTPHARYRHRHGIACRGSISGFPALGGSQIWDPSPPLATPISGFFSPPGGLGRGGGGEGCWRWMSTHYDSHSFIPTTTH